MEVDQKQTNLVSEEQHIELGMKQGSTSKKPNKEHPTFDPAHVLASVVISIYIAYAEA